MDDEAQRRVALARAFVNKPRYLLLDEPFVSLDLPTAQKLRQLLLQLWRSCRSSVLFVTHDLREALYLADRILFMSSSPGQIVYDYTVDLTRPRDSEGSSLESMRRQLLARNPEILAGLVLENEPDVA